MTKKTVGKHPVSEDQGLEGRLERLAVIVERLEASDVELGEALSLFEEAVGHVREAEKLLADAQLRVDELIGHGEDAVLRPLDAPLEDGEAR